MMDYQELEKLNTKLFQDYNLVNKKNKRLKAVVENKSSEILYHQDINEQLVKESQIKDDEIKRLIKNVELLKKQNNESISFYA